MVTGSEIKIASDMCLAIMIYIKKSDTVLVFQQTSQKILADWAFCLSEYFYQHHYCCQTFSWFSNKMQNYTNYIDNFAMVSQDFTKCYLDPYDQPHTSDIPFPMLSKKSLLKTSVDIKQYPYYIMHNIDNLLLKFILCKTTK